MPPMDRREWILTAATTTWVVVVSIAATLSQPGCRSDLLTAVGWAIIPVTLVLPLLAAWAVRRNPVVVFVLALVTVGLFNFLAYAILAGNSGCFE
jgi:hypothetical protein